MITYVNLREIIQSYHKYIDEKRFSFFSMSDSTFSFTSVRNTEVFKHKIKNRGWNKLWPRSEQYVFFSEQHCTIIRTFVAEQ
jgi:hypothetical protein